MSGKTITLPSLPSRRNIKKRHLVIIILVGLLLVGGYVGYTKYQAQQEEIRRLSNPQEAAKVETARLKEKVAQLIEVPQKEDPTVATVVDASKLKNQAFFAKAQNGDRVLIFAQAKKAILYRPSTEKIIEVAPINIGNNQTNQTETPANNNQAKPPAGR